MRDYKLGKIYKLHILGNDDLIYYGSTIQSLSVRLAGHKAHYKRYKEGKSKNCYSSFKLFETGKYVLITLLENFACNSKYELEARERFWIENNKCINKIHPTRTKKEYYKANADKIKEYRKTNADKIKKYYKANADKCKEYNKEYRKANTDKIKIYKKEYCKKNADKIKEYKKEYYKTNADKLKDYWGGGYKKNQDIRIMNAIKLYDYYNNGYKKNDELSVKYASGAGWAGNAGKVNGLDVRRDGNWIVFDKGNHHQTKLHTRKHHWG